MTHTALAAWYDSHPEIRRLWAVRDAQGLRVMVFLEPTYDGDDTQPAWIAHGHTWARELQAHTGVSVRLEQIDEPLVYGVETDVVATFSWRDPSQITE
jgi:hypothetical protein